MDSRQQLGRICWRRRQPHRQSAAPLGLFAERRESPLEALLHPRRHRGELRAQLYTPRPSKPAYLASLTWAATKLCGKGLFTVARFVVGQVARSEEGTRRGRGWQGTVAEILFRFRHAKEYGAYAVSVAYFLEKVDFGLLQRVLELFEFFYDQR